MNFRLHENYERKSVVFDVQTQRGVFPMTNRRNWSIEDSAVVWVNAASFLALWRNERFGIHSDIAEGSPETWVKDDKFDRAERGFMASIHGAHNPVPLARVSCREEFEHVPTYEKHLFFFRRKTGSMKQPYVSVSFTDGITRTVWLLTHGCEQFPVQCGIGESGLLHMHAGLPGVRPVRVSDFFK